MEKKRVIAIVPAHNEERTIGDTISSLLNQTYHTDVFVISDNSTDKTVETARSFGVMVAETAGNKNKKAGAHNQAMGQIYGYDYVICCDADTIISDNFVEIAIEEFRRDPQLGAICSRAGIIRPKTMTWWQQALWHIQHVEYAEFDTARIEKAQHIKVVHGMASVYRYTALRKVEEFRRKTSGVVGQFYDERNITEDYELTVCMKELGYHVSAGMGMMAWTDVPLSFRELWIQRTRWLRGGLDTLLSHGWNRATYRDILNAAFFWVMLAFHALLLSYIVADLLAGIPYRMSAWTALVLLLLYVDAMYRLKFVQDLEFKDVLFKALFVPMIIYTWFNLTVQLYAYYLSFSNIQQGW
jgi:poly-beta-1,6-N-acetyl-D-glucosamine synthase